MKRLYYKLKTGYDRMTPGERILLLVGLLILGSVWAIYDFGHITK